jgi:hypothetical protein
MKPEIEAKLVVAVVVSLVAFGFATSTVMVMGLVANITPSNQLNLTKQSEFPTIFSSRPNSINTTQQQPQVTTNTQDVNIEPSTDSSSSQNTNQNSNSQSNQTNTNTSNSVSN